MRLRCPVCGAEKNASGQPFASEWAVATHVAGKICGSSDRLHKSWAIHKAHVVDTKSVSVPKLADMLMWVIHQELETDVPAEGGTTPLSVALDIERRLHEHIRNRLQGRFGSTEEEWWVQGVPLQIRQDCATRREADAARGESYGFTYLIDLRSILDKNWSLFEPDFNQVRATISSKREFLDQLGRLNDVRNRHAHAVRAPEPESEAFKSDLAFALRSKEIVSAFCGD